MRPIFSHAGIDWICLSPALGGSGLTAGTHLQVMAGSSLAAEPGRYPPTGGSRQLDPTTPLIAWIAAIMVFRMFL